MRSNASILPLFLLLAGCGGWGYSDVRPEPGMSPAAQAMPPYERPEAPGGRAGAGYQRPDSGYDRAPPAYPQQDAGYDRPGASYERPDPGYDRPAPSYDRPAQSHPAQDPYADPAAGATGPRGTSQRGANEARYDEVGYAGVRGVQGGDAGAGAVVAVHRSLPAGTFVEVTSLETGRTILVLVTGPMGASDHPLDLSPGAARLLGASGSQIPVRVRKVNPPPHDQMALRAGQPASDRAETPPVLLNALRKQLPAAFAAQPVAADPGTSYARPAPAAGRGYYVQVAALSNSGRAQALAASLGGFVRPGNGLYRIQLGPFRTTGEAEAARADAADRGFGDARVFTQK